MPELHWIQYADPGQKSKETLVDDNLLWGRLRLIGSGYGLPTDASQQALPVQASPPPAT